MIQRPSSFHDARSQAGAALVECLVVVILVGVLGGVVVFLVDGMTA